MMGSRQMEKRAIGKIPFEKEVHKMNIQITFLIKQTFRYSTIPLFHVRARSSGLYKKTLFSKGCTNYENFNYGVRAL